LKEIKEIDRQLKELEKELEAVETDIQRWKEYVLNAELIKESFKYFSRIFPQLSPPEQKGVLRMLIKEIVFTPSQITIHFFEIPEEEIRLNLQKAVGFEENFKRKTLNGSPPVRLCEPSRTN
jgi:hypothetical protein